MSCSILRSKSDPSRSFEALKRGGRAEPLYGAFGARMDVELVNDGPVTVMLEA